MTPQQARRHLAKLPLADMLKSMEEAVRKDPGKAFLRLRELGYLLYQALNRAGLKIPSTYADELLKFFFEEESIWLDHLCEYDPDKFLAFFRSSVCQAWESSSDNVEAAFALLKQVNLAEVLFATLLKEKK